MICKNCQKEIANDSKFCEFCGSKVSLNKEYKEVIDRILKEKEPTKKEAVLSLPEQLNKKMWYRTLKVLYFLGIIAGIIISLGVAIDDGESVAFFILALATFLISEILKRSFYYIYLGKIFPKKSNKT